ncbi:D-2-hydroxyacid dehydrogenase family protein [Tatumella citrea]|uniref:Hydroxyacid dehydrogenase n=1 Tax=Tatumella citrea TaxID=53336 RepID=A0A1Y0LLR9_TATCI|nr:D-2-hydroxyacid dehydrogenase family protein [Tatumella citrea]ARU94531.1 hydroxyacid dehydrogenase [Tatumella citrea]ARU98569.1 hydroxyacid dehydrogenase [Tatumella citrea]
MQPYKCFILDDYQSVAEKMADWSKLPQSISIHTLHSPLSSLDQQIEVLKDATILVVMRERTAIARQLLSQLPSLKLIVTSGMRNAAIDIAAATELGITVCGTESSSVPPAELAWGLLLALSRQICSESSALAANGPWQSTVGMTLQGKKLGIIGLGKTGKLIARYAQAFGMEVYAWSSNLTEAQAQQQGVTFVASKREILQLADVITLHLVSSPRSHGIISYSDLQQMKKTALLINTSRAELIAEGALVRALENGDIAAAAIDVFEQEPLAAGSVYRTTRNLLATPHLGYVSDTNYHTFFGQAIEDIQAWLNGEPLRVLG